jgi:tetratricopeptide (TPR) repeat protein
LDDEAPDDSGPDGHQFGNTFRDSLVRNLFQSQNLNVNLGDNGTTWQDYWHPEVTSAEFIGREREIAWLEQRVSGDSDSAKVVSIHGFGGMGKTTLAVEFSNRRRADFDGRVAFDFQSYGRNPSSAETALRRLLPTVCSMSPERVSRLDPPQLHAVWESVTAGRKLLMLWDNVRDPQQIQALLAWNPGCVTLVTSRDRFQVEIELGSHPLELGELPPRDSVALYQSIAKSQDSIETIERLAELDLHVPLLIASHAASIARGFTSLKELVSDLDSVQNSGTASRHQELFRSRLAGSYSRLSRAERSAFRAFGVHPGSSVTAGSMAAVLDCSVDRAVELMDALIRAGLAQRDFTGGGSSRPDLRAYRSHDLIRMYGLHLADRWHEPGRSSRIPSDTERFTTALIQHYKTNLSSYTHLEKDWFAVESESLHKTATARNSLDNASLAAMIGWVDIGLNEYELAQEVFDHGIEICIEAKDQFGVDYMRRGLAQVSLLRGDFDQAVHIFGEVADSRTGAGDLVGVAHSLIGLGHATKYRGQYDHAINHFQFASARYGAAGQILGVADSDLGIGQVFLTLGFTDSAEFRFDEAARVYRQSDDLSRIASAELCLADVKIAQGDTDASPPLLESCFNAFTEIGDRVGLAETYISLADLAALCDDQESVVKHLKRAGAVFTEIGLDRRAEALRQRLT